ncbi:hypothetical+protein [Methylocapsa aurea]
MSEQQDIKSKSDLFGYPMLILRMKHHISQDCGEEIRKAVCNSLASGVLVIDDTFDILALSSDGKWAVLQDSRDIP